MHSGVIPLGWLEGGWFIVIKRGAPPSGVPSRQELGLPYPAQLSGAARERTRLRDIHGELQLSWSEEQGEARGVMLQGVLEESGAAQGTIGVINQEAEY